MDDTIMFESRPTPLSSLSPGDKFIFTTCAPKVYTLLKYDGSLTTYERHDGSVVQTSEAYFVHRVLKTFTPQEPSTMQRQLPTITADQVLDILIQHHACWVSSKSTYEAAMRVHVLFQGTGGKLDLLNMREAMKHGRLGISDARWFMANGGTKILVPEGLSPDAVFDQTPQRIKDWLNPPKKTTFTWGELKPGDTLRDTLTSRDLVIVSLTGYLGVVLTDEFIKSKKVLVLEYKDGSVTWSPGDGTVDPRYLIVRTSNPALTHLVTK